MSVTTKHGDNGLSDIYNMRVPKSDLIFDVLGTIDELNCWIGVCYKKYKVETLLTIQSTLSQCMVAIYKQQDNINLSDNINELENYINDYQFQGFVTPSNKLHIARAVCRRAERCICKVQTIPDGILQYINRLSDYLFVLAERYA